MSGIFLFSTWYRKAQSIESAAIPGLVDLGSVRKEAEQAAQRTVERFQGLCFSSGFQVSFCIWVPVFALVMVLHLISRKPNYDNLYQ